MKRNLGGIAIGLGALGLSLAACGGGGDKAETTPATAAPAAAPAPTPAEDPAGPPHLKFAEMTVYEGTNAIFKIHADGKTEVAGKPAAAGGAPTWSEGPAVTADGTITFKQQKVAKVDQDGTMKNLRNGQVIPVKVGTDTLTAQTPNGDMVLQIKEDGSIAVPGAPAGQGLKVEGATDPETRRTAMALIGAIFLSAKAEAAAPQGGAQPAPGGAAPAQPGAAQPAPAQPAPAAPAPAPAPTPKPKK
ncbi:MAG TPA: hypothetical protein VKB80_00980 [Kofleriaceae bacterium]|nr:hypothetical protein [Kofleriaceae bacterium]